MISTASTAVWQLALKWIHDCTTSHEICRPKDALSPFLPTRLIDVGSAENPSRLTITASDHVDGPYVALSYCWGGANGIKLTSTNIEELKLGLSLDKFPTTLQDAIKVTKKLNIRYIWIDSLCILQDSEDDWKREAIAMKDVYSNCLLTIAALGPASSDMGLFGKRDPLMYKPCWMFEKNEQSFFAHPRDPVNHFDYSFNNAVLHSRGWVMQERILSPRTLNFGTSLIWECREKLLEEYTADVMEGRSLKRRFFLWQSLGADTVGNAEFAPNDFLRLWNVLLNTYTKSELSFKTDRSVAISGLIQLIDERTGWRTVAGLWRPFILQQLLWNVVGDLRTFRNNASPTWSWWAIDSAVSFPTDLNSIIISSSSHSPSNGGVPMKELATVEAVEETDYNEKVCSKLYTIRLRCTIATVKNLPRAGAGRDFTWEGWPITSFQYFKADTGPLTWKSCYYIPLLSQGEEDQVDSLVSTFGLAIVPSMRMIGTYERLGFIKNRTRQVSELSRTLEDTKKITITLI